MGKLRQLFESIAYAGLKPQVPGSGPAKPKSAWRQRLQQWIDGPVNTDPLYLSNRTIGQRIRAAAVIAAPLLVVLGVLALAWSGVFEPQEAPKVKELTPAEKAAQILPNFNSNIEVPASSDLDVPEVHPEQGSPTTITGMVRNNTDHVVSSATLVFDLTDDRWVRLGAVSTPVEKLPPHSTTPFRFTVVQATAKHVLVREIHVP